MSEISTDIIITNILNGMMPCLEDEQLKQLKEILYIQLHDVELFNKCYDLVETIQDNDTAKLNYFEASMRIGKFSDNTIAQYIREAKHLRNFIGKNFADITTIDIKFYLASNQKDHHWKDSTIQTNIHYLNAFYNFLYKEEIISKNPMLKIDKIHPEKVIKQPYTVIEMEQMRIICRNSVRDMALIEFLNATGIRVGELIKLKWRDIDMMHLSFIVHGKGNKEREVKFSEKAGFYLLRYMDARMTNEKRTKEEIMDRPLFVSIRRNKKTKDYEALSVRSTEDIIKRISIKAGVEEAFPHKFRRTFATNAINSGMKLEDLMVLMGHNQYDTTLGYAQIKSARVEQAYRSCCDKG